MSGEIISAGPWAGAESRFWSGGSLGGIDLPGLVRVKVSRANNWDRKVAKGAHGETQTFNGRKSADVDITIRVWTEEDWLRLSTEIMPMIEPPAGKETPKPLDLVHPVAVSRGVKAIQVDSIAGPDANESGIYELQIKAFEFAPVNKSNANGTAKGGGGGGGGTPCQQAKAEYDAEAQRLRVLSGKGITDFGSSEEIDQWRRDLQASEDRLRYISDMLRENGCNADSPPSAGAAGGAGGGTQ